MSDDPLFNVNRLVEFGLGMSLAQHMVSSMNQAIGSAYTPGTSHNAAALTLTHFHVAIDGKRAGPFSDIELSKLIMERRVTASTLVWRSGMLGWVPASDVPEVLRLVLLSPPPIPGTE